jgi:hypothetical protein
MSKPPPIRLPDTRPAADEIIFIGTAITIIAVAGDQGAR